VAKEKVWLGTREAAEQLGVTLRTLYRLIDDGEIPAYQIGRVIRVRVEDLTGYLAAARISPGDLRHLHESTAAVAEPGHRSLGLSGQ
jgi:excisionase family DNA binding protein